VEDAMTDQEREQVLKMIETGKISPEEGLKLMRTLDQSSADDEIKTEPAADQPGPVEGSKTKPAAKADKSSFDADPRIEGVKSTVRRLWQIPLWIGVTITILGAWGMYTLVQASRLNFWFYCFNTPLMLLGVVLILLAIGSRKATWVFVDVHQKPDEKPSRIFLGLPLPLKFLAGLLRIFLRLFPNLTRKLDEKDGPGAEGFIKILDLLESGIVGKEPLVVNVDEGEEGERVQVYIG
jgi:hypothetical protein